MTPFENLASKLDRDLRDGRPVSEADVRALVAYRNDAFAQQVIANLVARIPTSKNATQHKVGDALP
jgi:hypothetical protein